MCWVLMSISQTVFNSLAASLLTPTRNFKGALLWIPQSCIKNVNLGDMLTTQLCMLQNSNEDPDHLRSRKASWPRPTCRSIFPSDHQPVWISNKGSCRIHSWKDCWRAIFKMKYETGQMYNKKFTEASLNHCFRSIIVYIEIHDGGKPRNNNEPLSRCCLKAKKQQHSEAKPVFWGPLWRLLT